MPIAKNNGSENAMGGTEIMKNALEKNIDSEVLDNFQIFVSRVHENLSDQHIRILWLHDLPGDPESDHLKNNGWAKFHKLVFVSNWQMRGFIQMYGIPWSKCVVIQNSIEPIPSIYKPEDKIRLIYTPTPHRGLNILYSVFDVLSKKYDNIELDVYSSYKLYGWQERDKEYAQLFDALKAHPKVNYHGSVPNDELRVALQKSHIFAYPSIWEETSCICLMEAMSAGLVCVHPNYGALPETASMFTEMYQMQDTMGDHADVFHRKLDIILGMMNTGFYSFTDPQQLQKQKDFADSKYNRNEWAFRWKVLLQELMTENPSRFISSGQFFSYKTS